MGSGASLAIGASLVVPMSATGERVGLHAWRHPGLAGGALVAVEAQSTGLTLVELPPGTTQSQPRLLATLRPPPGCTFCGVGLLGRGGLLAAGARHASGNVGLLGWRLLGDSRELQVLPATVAPATAWDALAAGPGKAAVADAGGDSVVTRALFHGPTGLLVLATAPPGREGASAGHGRLPLLQLADEAPEAAPTPAVVPMHTGLGFWTARDADGVVSKLRFPRYVHVIR